MAPFPAAPSIASNRLAPGGQARRARSSEVEPQAEGEVALVVEDELAEGEEHYAVAREVVRILQDLTARAGDRADDGTPLLNDFKEIVPYRSALAMFEYEVLEVLAGELGDERIRIARWAILNGGRQSAVKHEMGEEDRLLHRVESARGQRPRPEPPWRPRRRGGFRRRWWIFRFL